MSEWLELELAEELRPASAPNELWERIRTAPPRPIARRNSTPLAWPVAAIVTTMIAAATLWFAAKGQEPAGDLEQLAIQQLRDPSPLDLRSSDPVEVYGWLHLQAGVNLSLPSHSAARLVGARVIRTAGNRIALVSYRVGDDDATLLIARADSSANSRHGRLQWKSHGQMYALACSNVQHPEAACLLCHASL